MATLNGVQRSMSGPAPGAKKRTRHGSSPSKTNPEDLAKHSFPTLQSSSTAEHESDDSLDWPSTGPFTYHRWHVMIERWAQCLWSGQRVTSLAHSKAFIVRMICEFEEVSHLGNQCKRSRQEPWSAFCQNMSACKSPTYLASRLKSPSITALVLAVAT